MICVYINLWSEDWSASMFLLPEKGRGWSGFAHYTNATHISCGYLVGVYQLRWWSCFVIEIMKTICLPSEMADTFIVKRPVKNLPHGYSYHAVLIWSRWTLTTVCFCISYKYTHGFLLLHFSMIWFSYTLSREYRVTRNRYSRLLFTREDRLCTKLHVQGQSVNMTSQCQYPTVVSRHRYTVVASQYIVRKDRP